MEEIKLGSGLKELSNKFYPLSCIYARECRKLLLSKANKLKMMCGKILCVALNFFFRARVSANTHVFSFERIKSTGIKDEKMFFPRINPVTLWIVVKSIYTNQGRRWKKTFLMTNRKFLFAKSLGNFHDELLWFSKRVKVK